MLDPFEEQFDLPAGLIDVSNGAGSEFEVVGQEGVLDAGMGVSIANTPQPDGAVFCLGAGELDDLIAGQAFVFGHRSALTVTEPTEAMTRYRAFVFSRVIKEMPLLFSWLYQA